MTFRKKRQSLVSTKTRVFQLALALLLSIATFIAISSSVWAAPTLKESYTAGADGDSASIYGPDLAAMQFTSSATAHTVVYVRLPLKRSGSPGTITVSLRNAAAGVPTGDDLAYVTFNGNNLTAAYVYYQFVFNTEYSLLASTQYAIVVSAPSGDAANYVLWQWDSGGGIANAVASHATDGGISWTSDTPADLLFEVWGNAALIIHSARVFSNYMAADNGDLLFTAEITNIYPPYYTNNDDPRKYFQVQLLSIDKSIVLGAVPMWRFGYNPVSIYLSPASAASITREGGYWIRITGTFASPPTVDYQLVAADWMGSNLLYLDQWVIHTALNMETYYSAIGSFVTTLTDVGLVLTNEGGAYFTQGIPGLSSIRPNLFYTSKGRPQFTLGTESDQFSGPTTAWETQVGTKIKADANTFGALFGASGSTFLGWFFMILIILIMMVGVSMNNGAGALGMLVLCIPILMYANQLRVIDIRATLVMASLMVFFFIRQFWWKTT